MNINMPGITQTEFEYAFECLEDCKQPHAIDYGFPYPYFAPGGGYGAQWWQIDSALALSGYKWVDRRFCEKALLNFIVSQKEDGRICLWGKDVLPPWTPTNWHSIQNEGVSSLPKIFDVSHQILQGTTDLQLIIKTDQMLRRYIDWWYHDRFDENTGLFTAVFEETFPPYQGSAMEYAPVDTNVELYVGLICTAQIAERLGKQAVCEQLKEKAAQLKRAINMHLWDEEKGAYYPYDIRTGQRVDCLMASTFYPLRMQIASETQKKRLIALMMDDTQFNWNTIPLTSVSKKDPIFQTTIGPYMGNASWSGNVWTLINEMVTRGLLDCGEKRLAAELAQKTVRAFNHNCCEFVHPFDGTGHGVKKYAWSASQYLELLIEVIFGVHVNAHQKEVYIVPNLPLELQKEKLSMTGLMIFEDVYLDVFIENGKVHWNCSDPQIKGKA